MAYDAYDRFIEAAKKFPRWTNLRRRPTESVGGKILRSIIEEIAAVEDAIIEYKKDFFIVNYIGREEDIADYLYVAQVGDVEDIESLELTDPYYAVTDDEAAFYEDKTLAYYKDGYVVLWDTNETNTLTYFYNEFEYTAPLTSIHVWNIFDEFAWWCGLERFAGERNQSLMQRCLYQFRRHPNSTEEGIRNAILNTASAKDDILPGGETIPRLEADEIKFLTPDEETLSKKNEDGITLYEEISQFNRDIARTRQWDMDYWDNAFRKLYYLPHVWDAEMDICQDGVGYQDALHVTTLDQIDREGMTDVSIYGYVDSPTAIESYINSHDIRKNITLSLTKYNDTIKPLPVQYRIIAEDLIPVEQPEEIKFQFYRQYTGEREYYIDDFIKTWDYTTRTRTNGVTANTPYHLTFSANADNESRIEVTKCDLVINGTVKSLLEEQPDKDFAFLGGHIVHKGILFHGTKTIDFVDPENLEDCQGRVNGIRLANPLLDGSFTIRLHNEAFALNQQFSIQVEPNTGWNKIGYQHPYITAEQYTYNTNTEVYTSPGDAARTDKFRITIPAGRCRRIKFKLGAVNKIDPAIAEIRILRDGINIDTDRCDVRDGYDFLLEQEGSDMAKELCIEISRYVASAIIVSSVFVQSYDFDITVSDGNQVLATIPYTERIQMQIPGNANNAYLYCTVKNNGGAEAPIIRSVHVGPEFKNLTYELDFTPESDGELEIETGCQVTLTNRNTGAVITNFDPHFTYQAEPGATGILSLDLSEFETIYYTEPALKKSVLYGENAYTWLLREGAKAQTIRICGTRYHQELSCSLAELVNMESGDTLYYAKSAGGFIKTSDQKAEIVTIDYDDVAYGDRVDIVTRQSAIMASFVTANHVTHIAKSFTGVFESVYLFKDSAKQYIAYNTEKLTRNLTTGISIIPCYIPMPGENASLWYQISPIKPLNDVDVYYEKTTDETRRWSIDPAETLTIEVQAYSTNAIHNTDIFETELNTVSQNVLVSNYIDLSQFADSFGPIDLSRYSITTPDGMEVIYGTESYSQDADEDGEALYVEEDGFNKLYHANILSVTRIKIGNRTYDTPEAIDQILTLLPEEGILCWKDNTLQGQRIWQVDYTYNRPDALRYKNIRDLYERTGYTIDAADSVNKDSYKETNKKDGDSFTVDMSHFTETPTWITAVCSNPCYRAFVSDNTITVSRIAEDHAPVVHNGFYYVDGLEYYFFSDRYKQDLSRTEGLSIENGYIQKNQLYLYQEAVNHLQNSRMECNHLEVHCIVDFIRPRIATNIDPMGHIGACEAFTAWDDYNTDRSLVAYKNGYATKFTIQENGYAILDITPYIKRHTTVSCLYTGQLKFALAKEIHILNQQALKSVYCKPVADFDTYRDIAYCVQEPVDTSMCRYYLVVKGEGILDEILIHDLTEPEQIAVHHIKAIDKLGFSVSEKNAAKSEIVTMEYSSDFMRYHQLETDTDTSLRTGTTIDWNITKLHSYDLSFVKTSKMLYRSGVLVAQANNAEVETQPIEINYRASIKKAALKINKLQEGVFQGFTIKALGSNAKQGTYTELAKIEDNNLLAFTIRENDHYIKFKITAKENQILADMDLFAEYKETATENLPVNEYIEGSAVTKIFDLGATGNYRFHRVVCEEGFDTYDSIYIRGAKKSWTGEYVWTEWKNTAAHPEFYNYALFQYKIQMSGNRSRLRIKAFEFEVL